MYSVITRCLAVLGAACFFGQSAWSQTTFIRDPLLASDAATDDEIKRIAALPIPPVPLIASQAQEALYRVEQYTTAARRTFTGAAVAADADRRKRIDGLVQDVMASGAACDTPKLSVALTSLIREVNSFNDQLFGYSYGMDVLNRGVSAADQEAAERTRGELMSGSFTGWTCAKPGNTKEFFGGKGFKASVDARLAMEKQQASNIVATLQEEKGRAEKLAAAWNARYKNLEGKVDKATADLFLSQLPWIVLMFVIFALSMMLSVKLLAPDVQMEWVASGQVTQFASVTILLIIVSTLGIIGKIEGQTVGTLLGGIAGYILSQGVGRAAAARARERDSGRSTAGDGQSSREKP